MRIIITIIALTPCYGFLGHKSSLRGFGLAAEANHEASPWAVFDGCFNAATLESLKSELMREDEEKGIVEDTRVIDREGDPSKWSQVEAALVSWVDALGDHFDNENENDKAMNAMCGRDSSRFIEWWWRDEWYIVYRFSGSCFGKLDRSVPRNYINHPA